MKTHLIAVAVLLLSANVSAADLPQHPGDIVASYECTHMDPKITAFSCSVEHGVAVLRWLVDAKTLSVEQRDLSIYQINSFIVRYFQLGEDGFLLQEFGAPKNVYLSCTRSSQLTRYGYTCAQGTLK